MNWLKDFNQILYIHWYWQNLIKNHYNFLGDSKYKHSGGVLCTDTRILDFFTLAHQSCFLLCKCRNGKVIFAQRCFHDEYLWHIRHLCYFKAWRFSIRNQLRFSCLWTQSKHFKRILIIFFVSLSASKELNHVKWRKTCFKDVHCFFHIWIHIDGILQPSQKKKNIYIYIYIYIYVL